jgi:hypothetical protein
MMLPMRDKLDRPIDSETLRMILVEQFFPRRSAAA